MKYLKPTSVTWWASIVPLGAGVFLAAEPVHQMTAWVATVDAMSGGLHPAALINAGLFGIGLRGAVE